MTGKGRGRKQGLRTEFTSLAIGQEQKGVEASQREIPVHSADIFTHAGYGA